MSRRSRRKKWDRPLTPDAEWSILLTVAGDDGASGGPDAAAEGPTMSVAQARADRLRALEDSAERASLAHWRAAEWARLSGQYDHWRTSLAAARVASVVVMARWAMVAKLVA
jgi:hypothetical protein